VIHLSTEVLLGINAINHDASVALTAGSKILFAGHAERYSRVKNDSDINFGIIDDCLSYGKPEAVCWFEKPWLKFSRQWYSGESIDYYTVKEYLTTFKLQHLPIYTVKHHEAHAALGFFTSGFDNASVLIVDAIGEWNCTSIWQGEGTNLKKKFTLNYPNSIGLFYSAVTKAVGLKPNEEEYILMGMAAYGQPIYAEQMLKELFVHWGPPNMVTKDNLHMGLEWYFSEKNWCPKDIAASVQLILEKYMLETCRWINKHLPSKNLVIVGGVALNCVANSKIRDADQFDNIWIPPNSGDGGLSLGAICAVRKRHIKFQDAYLGYNIDRPLDIENIIETLSTDSIVGVANGRAEFGPRALGNRSLLADPRGIDIKDKVNSVKKRDLFRPFAPVILEEHKSIFSNTKHNQEYMQWTNFCTQPDLYPAVCHVDKTSRIQTVAKNNSNIRKILEAWYEKTGCPMLLNTSLNIKGQPLVNTWTGAENFEKRYDIRVY
jgi:carbamoyltransferase